MSQKTAPRGEKTARPRQVAAIEQPRYSLSVSPEGIMLLAQALTSASFQNSASMSAAGELMAQIEPIAQALIAQADQNGNQG